MAGFKAEVKIARLGSGYPGFWGEPPSLEFAFIGICLSHRTLHVSHCCLASVYRVPLEYRLVHKSGAQNLKSSHIIWRAHIHGRGCGCFIDSLLPKDTSIYNNAAYKSSKQNLATIIRSKSGRSSIIHTYLHIQISAYIHIHIYIHTYTYIYIHTHIHIQSLHIAFRELPALPSEVKKPMP